MATLTEWEKIGTQGEQYEIKKSVHGGQRPRTRNALINDVRRIMEGINWTMTKPKGLKMKAAGFFYKTSKLHYYSCWIVMTLTKSWQDFKIYAELNIEEQNSAKHENKLYKSMAVLVNWIAINAG